MRAGGYCQDEDTSPKTLTHVFEENKAETWQELRLCISNNQKVSLKIITRYKFDSLSVSSFFAYGIEIILASAYNSRGKDVIDMEKLINDLRFDGCLGKQIKRLVSGIDGTYLTDDARLALYALEKFSVVYAIELIYCLQKYRYSNLLTQTQ